MKYKTVTYNGRVKRFKLFPKVCEFCENDFETTDKKARFCSCHCALKNRWKTGNIEGGENNPNWKGGKSLNKKTGYVTILMRDHPRSGNHGRIYEHRYVMEQHLGRTLNSNELVHHINEDKSDNRIINLQVVTRGMHPKIIFSMMQCPHCKKEYEYTSGISVER